MTNLWWIYIGWALGAVFVFGYQKNDWLRVFDDVVRFGLYTLIIYMLSE